MGSIPASLNSFLYFMKLETTKPLLTMRNTLPSHLKLKYAATNCTKSLKKGGKLSYVLSFTSLLPFTLPSILFTTGGNNNSSCWSSRKTRFSRLMVKNSYLLFTWFYYLNSIYIKRHKFDPNLVPAFFTKPSKVSKFTITKAPMAHKTFSQEQYKVKFYRFLFKFTFRFNYLPASVNGLIFLINFLKYSFFFFETNFFFLNRIRFRLNGCGKGFLFVL